MISALYNDVDAPSLDHGAQTRLRRLNTNLCVTFSKWAIDPLTARPIVADREAGGGTILDPHWHLWIKTADRGWTHIKQYKHFGHEQIGWLEQDLGRFHSPNTILQMWARRREQVALKAREIRDQRIHDIGRQNKGRIRDLIQHGKSGRRTRKLASYAGQGNRSTPTREFLPDAREDGWDLPGDREA